MRVFVPTESIPSSSAGPDADRATGEVRADGATYEEALASAYAQIPEGFRAVWVHVERD